MKLEGVFTVLQMPLNPEDGIDEIILAKEIDWLIQLGVDGLVLAMVSEVMRFSAQERRDQWRKTTKAINGRLPLVASVGADSTAIAVWLAKCAEEDGVNALMATPPSSFPATPNETLSYYTAIIDSVAIPVIVQDASNYMGHPLEIGLYGALLNKFGHDRVQFKPEATPVKERMQALQEIAGGKAKVFEGQSGMGLMETFPLGLSGTMPGSEIPWAIIALWKALKENDLIRAQKIHTCVAQLVAFQTSIDAYVAVEKYLLVKQGIFNSTRQRGPIGFTLDEVTKSQIDSVFEQLRQCVSPSI